MASTTSVYAPAIACQLRPHPLQVMVPHILDAEEVNVRVQRDAFADVGVEAESQFFALFLCFREVDDFCTLGFWHRVSLRSGE